MLLKLLALIQSNSQTIPSFPTNIYSQPQPIPQSNPVLVSSIQPVPSPVVVNPQPVYVPSSQSSRVYYQKNVNYCKYCNGRGYKSNGKRCVCNGGTKSSGTGTAIALGTAAAVGLGLALLTGGKKHHHHGHKYHH